MNIARLRSFIRQGLAIILATSSLAIVACTSTPPPTTVTPSVATKLVFSTQPVGGPADAALPTQPVVMALDANGNVVTGYRSLLTLTITSGTGTSDAKLFGGITVIPASGAFRFTGLIVDKVGSGYTFTAKSGNLSAVSAPFDIAPGAATKLFFTTQPSGGVAGSPLTAQPVVTVQDIWGNTVSSYDGSVTLGITYGSGAPGVALSGASTVRVVNSVARFTGLSILKTGPEYTLTAMSEGLVPATSNIFKISPAAPAKLEFTVQPAGAKAGKPFETQPKVAVEDIYGNVVTTSRPPIALSITPGTGAVGAALSGTKTLSAEGGMGGGLAEFTDLSIDMAGSGYTLTATSSGLTPATSQAFDVAP